MWCHCALGNTKNQIYWEEKVWLVNYWALVKSLPTHDNPNACFQRLALNTFSIKYCAQSPLGQCVIWKVWFSRIQIRYSHIYWGENSHWLQGKPHELWYLSALLRTLHEVQHGVQTLFLRSVVFKMNYNVSSAKTCWWLFLERSGEKGKEWISKCYIDQHTESTVCLKRFGACRVII